MGFGLNLAKGAASTAVNALTGGLAGGLVEGIFGLFGGNKEKKQRQWQEQMMQKPSIVTGKQIGRAHV